MESKELTCGARGECWEFVSKHPRSAHLEIVTNRKGPECSVYYKRRKADRSIRKPVSRITRAVFRVNGVSKNHHRPIKVTMEPGDVITFCPVGTSQRVSVPISSLYSFAKFAAAKKRK